MNDWMRKARRWKCGAVLVGIAVCMAFGGQMTSRAEEDTTSATETTEPATETTEATTETTTEITTETTVALHADGWDTETLSYYIDGECVTGLQQIDGGWYYFDEVGTLAAGWQEIDGAVYYFAETGGVAVTGKAATGLTKIDGKKFLFDSNGKMKTGMKKVNGKKYYFSPKGEFGTKGAAATGWVTYKKACYYFSKKTCVMQKNKIVDGYKLDKSGKSKTRYKVLKIVNSVTNEKMTKKQKVKALFKYVVNNSWKYKRTYEHTQKGWKWYKGWTDDFAYDIISTGQGNCFRYAAALGYMIKEATGYQVRVYHGSTHSSSGGLCPHGWITVKIDGTWYAFDPDLYKYSGRRAIYYYQPYSKTKNRVHINGKYTALK